MTTTTAPPAPTAADVLAADRRRYAAMIANDLDTLDSLLGAALVYTHSDGRSDDKAAYLARLRAGTVRYVDARPEEVQVTVYGSSAVMHGRVVLITERNGVQRTLDNRFLNVWVQQASGWQMVAWASTPRPA